MSTSNWPSHTDYQDSIQNPHICFEDVTLKAGEVTVDMLGLPKVMSGNFASVYSVRSGSERFAIRCFVRQVMGQQGRYARMSQHLLGLGLDCMVTFEYILRGIKVRNEWYPVVKMAWVDGLPLNNFLEDNVDQPEVLRGLAAKWRVMMKSLRDQQLAHGDLQHGNVMVTPNAELRLVDYDGMYTPAFRGKSPELGHANFQHPRRTPDFYNETLDNFAGLVIYTSFIAIADEPELFQKFYTGDNLILLSGDYKNPTQSAALKRLKEHKNPVVRQLGQLIERCCLTDVSAVPEFGSVMEALDHGTLDQLIQTMPAPGAAPAAQPAAGGNTWWNQPDAPSFETGTAKPLTPSTPRPAAPASRPATPSQPIRPVTTHAATTPTAPRPATTSPRPATSHSPAKPAAPTGWPTQPPKTAAKPAPVPQQAPPPPAEDNTKLFIMLGVGGLIFLIIVFLIARSSH